MYMNILIPAAGLGTRFKDHYEIVKPTDKVYMLGDIAPKST